jgi:hypothetical protein
VHRAQYSQLHVSRRNERRHVSGSDLHYHCGLCAAKSVHTQETSCCATASRQNVFDCKREHSGEVGWLPWQAIAHYWCRGLLATPRETLKVRDSKLSECRTTCMVNRNSGCLGLVGVFASQPMFRGWTSTNHKAHKRLPSESQSWKGNRLFTSSAYTHNKCHHDMHTMIYSRT